MCQVGLIREGKGDEVVQETRLWDEGRRATRTMRRKEGLADYRYFPEPDLTPLTIAEEELEEIKVGREGFGRVSEVGRFMIGALVDMIEPLSCAADSAVYAKCCI